MMKILLFIFCLTLSPSALAQSSPDFYDGFVPTDAQWMQYFKDKQDTLGYPPVNKNGDTMLGVLAFSGASPAPSSCGTAPAISGNDQVGRITVGTGSPTSCTITFARGFNGQTPKCNVTSNPQVASLSWTESLTTLVVTQTATSSNKITWNCAPTP